MTPDLAPYVRNWQRLPEGGLLVVTFGPEVPGLSEGSDLLLACDRPNASAWTVQQVLARDGIYGVTVLVRPADPRDH